MSPPLLDPEPLGSGALIYRRFLSDDQQHSLGETVWAIAEHAGWIEPKTPRGKPFSVRQLNMGPLGWVSDAKGYRYEPAHPQTGQSWPAIPTAVLDIWSSLIGDPEPECCLVNHYSDTAKMGLHRDADEADMDTSILSISLGQPARFRLGGPARSGPTQSAILESGDVLVMGGPSRRFYHGIDRLLPPTLMDTVAFPFAGRLNLTLRRVTATT